MATASALLDVCCNNTETASVATPATSRVSNTSASSNRKKHQEMAVVKKANMSGDDEENAHTSSSSSSNHNNDHHHHHRLEQMLQEAEHLAARIRSTAGSSSSSSLGVDSSSAARETYMTLSRADTASQSIHEDDKSSEKMPPSSCTNSIGSPQPSRSSFVLREDGSSVTPSQSQQEQVDAAVLSSKRMEKALLALSQSQRDLALLKEEEEDHEQADDDDKEKKNVAISKGKRKASLPAAIVNHESVIWDKLDFAQEGDDDYVPMVDYSQGGSGSPTSKPSATPSKTSPVRAAFSTTNSAATKHRANTPTASIIDKTNGITWHKLDSPSRNDDDYVPLMDYSNRPTSSPSTSDSDSLDDSTAPFSPLTRQELYRRKNARMRKKRNKWILRILSALLLMVIVCFIFGFLAGEDAATDGQAEIQPERSEQPQFPPSRREQQQPLIPPPPPTPPRQQHPLEYEQKHQEHEPRATLAPRLRVEEVVNDMRETITPAPAQSHEGYISLQDEEPTRFNKDQTAEKTPQDTKSAESLSDSSSVTLKADPIPVQQQATPERMPRASINQANEQDAEPASNTKTTNSAKDSPCDTRASQEKLPSSSTTARESETQMEHIQTATTGSACNMALAEWLLPLCRESKMGTATSKSEKVFLLVQSMME